MAALDSVAFAHLFDEDEMKAGSHLFTWSVDEVWLGKPARRSARNQVSCTPEVLKTCTVLHVCRR